LHQVFLDDPNGVMVELNYPVSEKQAWDAQRAALGAVGISAAASSAA
jgi:hypothetical protein